MRNFAELQQFIAIPTASTGSIPAPLREMIPSGRGGKENRLGWRPASSPSQRSEIRSAFEKRFYFSVSGFSDRRFKE
jgi:hypothetical protein